MVAARSVTYPAGDARCEFTINANVCGAPDTSGNYLYNPNTFRDISSELDRYNLFFYVNHEFGNGVEAFTELSWYQADSNFKSDAAYFSIGESDLQLGPERTTGIRSGPAFYPTDVTLNPNRAAAADEAGIDPNGERMEVDNFRAHRSARESRIPKIISIACCRASAAVPAIGTGRPHWSGPRTRA